MYVSDDGFGMYGVLIWFFMVSCVNFDHETKFCGYGLQIYTNFGSNPYAMLHVNHLLKSCI